MADRLVPRRALDYIKNKSLRPAFSYKDVWNEEHAAAFTVAKTMQLDVLSDLKDAVEKAIEGGTTFEQFKQELKPTLMRKGWWGRKEMTDPLTGRTVDAQTAAPNVSYKNFFNERKRTLERIPEGITPGFNWNQGQTGRTVPVMQECLKKAQKEMPQAVDSVIKTLQNSTIYRDQLSDFVDQAYANKAAGRVNNKNTAPVGFLDRKLTDFLRTQGIDTGGRNIIVLEQSLITNDKYLVRHAKAGNAPTPQDWKNLMDYLADATVYWDNRKNKSLLFLKKLTEEKYLKISVDVEATERYLKLPKVDTMFYLDLAAERTVGSNEYNQIMGLKKVR